MGIESLVPKKGLSTRFRFFQYQWLNTFFTWAYRWREKARRGYRIPSNTPEYPQFTALYRATEWKPERNGATARAP
jgi:hypothetical protein